ncbi:CCB3-YggT [Babesia duncani]|uniref:CCB3-YggT n=1 Tax=Babesia duncani TaxID=323732 RepID=A0AAD9UNM9_9APIC|nr:CCB3-YggT [Babesia duncani]
MGMNSRIDLAPSRALRFKCDMNIKFLFFAFLLGSSEARNAWNGQTLSETFIHCPFTRKSQCGFSLEKSRLATRKPIRTRIGAIGANLEAQQIIKNDNPRLERFLIETWQEHGDTLILASVYGIRVFKFFILLRNLLEWLPQVNPYMPPFDSIYQLTDTYLAVFRAIIPPVSGVEISGAIAMYILDLVETLLSHRPNVAQQALA